MTANDIKIENNISLDDRIDLNDPIAKQISPCRICGFPKGRICIFRTCGEFYCRKHYPQHDFTKHPNVKTPPSC